MEKKANNEDKIMWKVMIVDDEKLICKLVQALVEWDKLGMQMGHRQKMPYRHWICCSNIDRTF